jgi:hypothetical protein
LRTTAAIVSLAALIAAACEIHNHPAPAPPSGGDPPVVVVPPVVLDPPPEVVPPPFPPPPEDEPAQAMDLPRLNQVWLDFVRTADGESLRIWTMTFGPAFPQVPQTVDLNHGDVRFAVRLHDSDRDYRIESRLWPVSDPFTVTHLPAPAGGVVTIPRALLTQTVRVAVEVRDPDTQELYDQFRFTLEAMTNP